MNGGAQMSFGFDLSPVALAPMPLRYSAERAARIARVEYLAGIQEKVDHDLDMYGEEDFNTPDFPEDA